VRMNLTLAGVLLTAGGLATCVAGVGLLAG